MSRKPCVVTSATLAPLLSSMVLMAIVEPCRKSRASARRVPALATPCVMPSTSRPGVLSVLPRSSSPERSSNAATSVKVPPMSAAMRKLVDTDSHFFDDFPEPLDVGGHHPGELFLGQRAGL